MSPPTSMTTEIYSPIIPLQFKGGIYHSFHKNEYNPNLLNDVPYVIISNETQEKIKENTQCFHEVYNKIFQLTRRYKLGSISLEQDIDNQYTCVFVIQIPKNYEYKKALKIWDKIISEMELYSISRGYEKFFKNIQIVLK